MEEKNFENKQDKKEIEIVQGNPKDLDISSVKDNLNFEVNDSPKKKDIIIPRNQKK